MRLTFVALLVALAPFAQAAESVPVHGYAEAAEPFGVSGDTEWSAEDGMIDLAPAILAGEPMNLSWASMKGWQVQWNFTTSKLSPEPVSVGDPWNRTLSLPAGRIVEIRCQAGCRAVLFSQPHGIVAIRGAESGPLQASANPCLYYAKSVSDGADNSFQYHLPSGAFRVGADADAIRMNAPVVAAHGTLGLMLLNMTLTVETSAGPVALSFDSTDTLGAGGLLQATEERFAVVQLTEARFASAPGTRATWAARSPSIAVHGSVASIAATGELVVNGATRTFEKQSLALDGDFVLSPAPARPGLVPILGSPNELSLEGHASSLVIGGAPVAQPTRSSTVVLAAGAGAMGLLGAALLLLRFAGLTPFYSRIDRSQVLTNQNRRAVYDAVRAHAGLSVSEVARSTDLARVVVRHHLMILVAHQYVQLRSAGHQSLYYAPEVSSTPAELETAWLLRDDTRRRVAALAAAASGSGITQRQTVQALGISQRLASYHLGKLETGGLLRRVDTTPQRYVADQPLEALLRGPN